jgi:hypothetical protein
MGSWLRVLLTRDVALRKRLSTQLNGGKLGFNRDEAGVVQAACELAVRKLWGTGYDISEIADAVTFMHEANPPEARDRYPQQVMEAVILAALGEPPTDQDIGDYLPRPLVFEVQMVVTGYVGAKLRFPAPTVDHLITDAERIARERGWNPPLVTGQIQTR